MKSTWAIALTIAVASVLGVCIVDDSFAEVPEDPPAKNEFPSLNDIISTIQPPDYSLDKFIEDAQYMFSPEMFSMMGSFGGSLVAFVTEDTFLAHLNDGTIGEQFNGNYINVFILICLIIAVICVLGAVCSYAKNRKVFRKIRV